MRAIFLCSIFLISCSHTKKEISVIRGLDKKPYKNDLVSLTTALQMAKSSYTLGCTRAYVANDKKKGSHSRCLKEAEAHIQADYIYLYEQDTPK